MANKKTCKPTKSPWMVGPMDSPADHPGSERGYFIELPDGGRIGEMFVNCGVPTANAAKANAELVCRSVNAHDDLLAALRDLIKTAEWHVEFKNRGVGDDVKRLAAARAAIAKAEGR